MSSSPPSSSCSSRLLCFRINNVFDTALHYRAELDAGMSVRSLKLHLSVFYPSSPPVHTQRLVFRGRLLEEEETLHDILADVCEEERVIHLAIKCDKKVSTCSSEGAAQPAANSEQDEREHTKAGHTEQKGTLPAAASQDTPAAISSSTSSSSAAPSGSGPSPASGVHHPAAMYYPYGAYPSDVWSAGVRARGVQGADSSPAAPMHTYQQSMLAYQQALQQYYQSYMMAYQAYIMQQQQQQQQAHQLQPIPSPPAPILTTASPAPAHIHAQPISMNVPASVLPSSSQPGSLQEFAFQVKAMFLMITNLLKNSTSLPVSAQQLPDLLNTISAALYTAIPTSTAPIDVATIKQLSSLLSNPSQVPSAESVAQAYIHTAALLASTKADHLLVKVYVALVPVVQTALSNEKHAYATTLYHAVTFTVPPLIKLLSLTPSPFQSAPLLTALLSLQRMQGSSTASDTTSAATSVSSSSSSFASASASAPAASPNGQVVNNNHQGQQVAQPQQQPVAAADQRRWARFVDFKLMIRYVILFVLFAQDGDAQRAMFLAIASILAYLYQVGAFRRRDAAQPAGGVDEEDMEFEMARGGFGANAAIPPMHEPPAHQELAGDGGVGEVVAAPAGGVVAAVEKFIVGLLASLHPSWRPTPVPVAAQPPPQPAHPQPRPPVQAN